MSKVCDTHDLLKPEVRALADEYMRLAADETRDWRANNHVFRAWEYTYVYQALRLKGQERICDVGSENSIFPIWLKKRHPDLQIMCIDPCLDGRLEHRAQVHQVALDIRKDFFGPHLGTFDRITCISVLEHVPSDLDLALVKLMAQQLNPGGVLAITVDYGDKDIYWPQAPHGWRRYGLEQVWGRIIAQSGLKLRDGGEGTGFAYRPIWNEVPGIDPLFADYTTIALVLDK